MTGYAIAVAVIIILDFLYSAVSGILNLRASGGKLPEEISGIYDEARYARSQEYLRENTVFGLWEEAVSKIILTALIFSGAFGFLDNFAREVTSGPVTAGLFFMASLYLLSKLLYWPLAAYHTFVIEAKYGFNRTTPKTFALDALKGVALTAVIGLPILALVLWFFGKYPQTGWLYVWGALSAVSVFLMFIAPVVIMPLFNKFSPLAEGPLRSAIESYAAANDFKIQGVYSIDGSKRSTKANAFFTGFGKFRRIALFDTLMQKLSVDELVSVLAHEVGHFKKKHIITGLISSLLVQGVMLYLLSFFIGNWKLCAALGFGESSVYAALLGFSIIYTPVNLALNVVFNVISRRHEYEADAFAAKTTGRPDALSGALKKLAAENLTNLTPHPFVVFAEYSHPPLADRLKHLAAFPVKAQ